MIFDTVLHVPSNIHSNPSFPKSIIFFRYLHKQQEHMKPFCLYPWSSPTCGLLTLLCGVSSFPEGLHVTGCVHVEGSALCETGFSARIGLSIEATEFYAYLNYKVNLLSLSLLRLKTPKSLINLFSLRLLLPFLNLL